MVLNLFMALTIYQFGKKHTKKGHEAQGPFSHLLITHSYLCSVLFTRSLKQVLMRTKGIRQAEGESPYTVKTEGAAWWKEGDSAPLTSHLKSLGHARASARRFRFSVWRQRPDDPIQSVRLRLCAAWEEQTSLLPHAAAAQSAENNRSFCFLKQRIRSESRSSISVAGPRRAL